jgi:hypothetical protein
MSSIDTVVFTGPDKSLLDRSARAAEAAAKALGWESILDSKKRKAAKLEYDRLLRDAHDLRQLGVRLSKLAKALKTPDKTWGPGPGFAERRVVPERRLVNETFDSPDRRQNRFPRRKS